MSTTVGLESFASCGRLAEHTRYSYPWCGVFLESATSEQDDSRAVLEQHSHESLQFISPVTPAPQAGSLARAVAEASLESSSNLPSLGVQIQRRLTLESTDTEHDVESHELELETGSESSGSVGHLSMHSAHDSSVEAQVGMDNIFAETHESRSLFVGDLGQNVSESMLLNEFSKYGKVTSVQIKRDRESGRSLGYCFVDFETAQDAENARRFGHRARIGSRAVRIGYAQRNTSLYVPSLAPSCTTKDLQAFFSSYGDLIESDTYVVTHKYGFVRFRTRAEAERAKRNAKHAVLCGQKVLTKWSEADLLRNVVQVQFNLAQSQFITRDNLYHVFHKFGRVVRIVLPEPATSAVDTRASAYVHFEESDAGQIAAENAIRRIKRVAGVQVYVLACCVCFCDWVEIRVAWTLAEVLT
ncbi:Polyadenylate-binding protein 1 [Porphyridium purpureum]|uniref:Polyadenylate-binding protein 1 n=1 Tax=Porphyridium purpureum TaxID=35688 RepID=A0A5J4YY08_PORPP|nr:Polyadenylate-binding protein 1 [Porphyridium purpureum]|eukprot:POR1456..scf208_2